MKTKLTLIALVLLVLSALNLQLSTGFAQGTAFTYQGQLKDGNDPANGSYDLRFKLFVDSLGNNQIGSAVLTNGLPVTNGLFTVVVDFGAGIFTGSNYWLEVDVKTNGAASYTDLSPLQIVTPTPYAIFANSANNLLASAQLSVTGLTIQNNAQGAPNVIGGSSFNYVSNTVFGATIGGGGQANLSNSVTADFGTISGGGGNTASGWASTVGGGAGNTASSLDGSATVGGGYYNTASGDSSTVGGGARNTANSGYATAGGGQANTASGFYAFVGGGYYNTASGLYATVGGGGVNTNGSPYATVGGGGYNTIGTNSNSGTVSGGFANQIAENTHDATIGGGSYSSIGTNSFASTIAGGSHNSIGTNASVAAIGGGTNNAANAFGTTIGGGANNTASAWASTVGGGAGNTASSPDGSATVGGGYGNTASGDSSTVGGGAGNSASGAYATVPGGYYNTASGALSFAVGSLANALYDGSFVWSDFSGGSFASTADNQFLIRAAGGVGINTNAPTGALTVNTGVGTLTVRSDGPVPALVAASSSSYSGYLRLRNHLEVWPNDAGTADGYVDIRGNNGTPNIMLDGQSGNITCIALNQTSDRNAKQDFAPVSSAKVLDEVLHLPVSEWSYKADPKTRHVGPMAQDFYAAFDIGTDDKHITTVDENGVALAAIQGLNEKVESGNQKAETRLEKLEAENAKLEAQLEKLEQLINSKTGEVK